METAREELGGHDAYDIIRSIEALEKAADSHQYQSQRQPQLWLLHWPLTQHLER